MKITDKENALAWYLIGADDGSGGHADEKEMRDYFESLYGNRFNEEGQEIIT